MVTGISIFNLDFFCSELTIFKFNRRFSSITNLLQVNLTSKPVKIAARELVINPSLGYLVLAKSDDPSLDGGKR